jgi:hypothetical protein
MESDVILGLHLYIEMGTSPGKSLPGPIPFFRSYT